VSDLELLLLVLALLYGWECACWLRRGSVAFRTWLGRGWRVVHPGALLGNQTGGFIFAAPLPPLGTLLTGNPSPLSLSPEGLLAYVAPGVNPGWRPPQPGWFVRFDDLRQVAADGKTVRINGSLRLKVGSPTFAQGLAERLSGLSKLPAAKREAALQQQLEDSLDADAAERRWREFQPHAARLRIATNVLFGYSFVLAPVVFLSFGLRFWLELVVGLLACTVAIALIFRRAHLAFFPRAEDERFTHFLIVLLSPATSLRAHDLVSRPLLEDFHPLAIAKVLCSEARFRDLAAQVLREIRHPAFPLCPSSEPAAQAAERWARAALQSAVEKLLRRARLDPDQLLAPPAPSDATCRAYCPHCLAQFTTPDARCHDCGGLPLAPLSVTFKTAPQAP
jgi:hypothetical protein